MSLKFNLQLSKQGQALVNVCKLWVELNLVTDIKKYIWLHKLHTIVNQHSIQTFIKGESHQAVAENYPIPNTAVKYLHINILQKLNYFRPSLILHYKFLLENKTIHLENLIKYQYIIW